MVCKVVQDPLPPALNLERFASCRAGSRCSDDQITGLLIGTLFAGQHTSSITTTWTALNILHHPPIRARIMAEQIAILGTDPYSTASLSFDTLNALDEMHRCMKESLRQAPPLIMLMREVHVPLSVPGAGGQRFTVPKGDLVFVSPAVTMNLPDSAPDCAFKVSHVDPKHAYLASFLSVAESEDVRP